jgi:hypothetical protein
MCNYFTKYNGTNAYGEGKLIIVYEKQHRGDLGPILPFWQKENVETKI